MAVGFTGAGWGQVKVEAGAGVVLVHFGYCCHLVAAAALCSEQRCWRS